MAASDTVKLYITGNLLEGADRAQAIIKMADLLNIPLPKVAKLIDGKPHLIRKDLPAAQVDKYRAALANAGFESMVRPNDGSAAAADTAASIAPAPTEASPTSDATDSSLDLLEVGSMVLTDSERPARVAADINTEHLQVADPDAETPPASREAPPPVPAPDLDVAEVGADIEGVAKPPPPPPPDTDDLSTAPVGSEFETLKKDKPAPPDVSHLSVAD